MLQCSTATEIEEFLGSCERVKCNWVVAACIMCTKHKQTISVDVDPFYDINK